MRDRNEPPVALVTCEQYPDLSADDRVLAQALAARGYRAVAQRWDAPDRPWEEHRALVIRSCWDYHRRPAEFLAWLEEIERRPVRVFNPVATMRWNARKTYLRQLAESGIPVVPTAWVDDATASLEQVMRTRGWHSAVVKPTVSATAFETWRVGPLVTPEDEHRFEMLRRQREVMVQPFLEQIERDGELSLVFLGGRFSHAVVKRPGPGDFRVQADFGGTAEPVQPSRELIAQAERVLSAAPAPCLYARIDGCVVEGSLQLMELEVIEPSLFFLSDAGAASRFVAAFDDWS
jgi:glutathione synthase/RimK-type ligase-like ATP-grasp enzyme